MEKSLTELSEEYFEAAEYLTKLIGKYTKLLNAAYSSNDFLKTYEIKRKLKILYDERGETLETAHLLKHYYDESEKCEAV